MATDFSKYGTPVNQAVATTAQPAMSSFGKYGTVVQEQATEQEQPTSALGKVAEFLAPTITRTVGKISKGERLTFRDVAGSALEAASYLVPAGAAGRVLGLGAKGAVLGVRAAKGAKAATKALGLGKRVLMGAGAGATAGGLMEAGRATGEGAGLGEIAKRTITGGTVGAAFGGALPVAGAAVGKAAGKLKSSFGGRAAQKLEHKALIEAGTPDARIATKALHDGKIVTDKVAKEVVRQGIPEADVALIKHSSAVDKAKMRKMLDIRQSQLTNKRVVHRATDVVGDTFVEKIAKPIEKLNKDARSKLDAVARGLSGKRADPTSAIVGFADDLEKAGVGIVGKGKLVFKGSDYEGLKGVQSLMSNVWGRAQRIARSGDAHQMHRLKTFIDEQVNYGKAAEGLSGRAQAILKSFRHNVDTILDSNFKLYNKVNTQYADTINELNNMAAAIGKTFRLGDTFADAQSGLAMRRILSNTQSRAEILKMLDGMQRVAKKYGVKIDEDVITQASFADILEKMLGSEAPTSFLGGIERAGQAASAGADIMQGKLVSGTIKAGKYAIDVTRGINERNKLEALKALLGSEPIQRAKSVFGRPK